MMTLPPCHPHPPPCHPPPCHRQPPPCQLPPTPPWPLQPPPPRNWGRGCREAKQLRRELDTRSSSFRGPLARLSPVPTIPRLRRCSYGYPATQYIIVTIHRSFHRVPRHHAIQSLYSNRPFVSRKCLESFLTHPETERDSRAFGRWKFVGLKSWRDRRRGPVHRVLSFEGCPGQLHGLHCPLGRDHYCRQDSSIPLPRAGPVAQMERSSTAWTTEFQGAVTNHLACTFPCNQ